MHELNVINKNFCGESIDKLSPRTSPYHSSKHAQLTAQKLPNLNNKSDSSSNNSSDASQKM